MPVLTATAVFGQKVGASGDPPGYPNRIEYQKFNWQVFHTPAFHVYFPKGADSLASFVSRNLIPAKAILAKRMGGTVTIPSTVIVYPSVTQQYESSIGRLQSQPLTVPSFVFRGNRIVLSYNGDYEALKGQLYVAVARASWEKGLERNENVVAQAKGTIKKQDVPYWFIEGAIRHFSLGWPLEDEEKLRAEFAARKPASFYEAASATPKLWGSAFCYYLAEQQRADAVAQLYALLRKEKPLDKAIRLLCKRPEDSVYQACINWYRTRFSDDQAADPLSSQRFAQTTDTPACRAIVIPKILQKNGAKALHFLLDPSGKKLAVVFALRGHRRQIFLFDCISRKAHPSIVYTLPPWLSDHEADVYPLLCWNPAGTELLAAMPAKGKLQIIRINGNGKVVASYCTAIVEGVNSISYAGAELFLFSAWRKGRSDLILYNAGKDKVTTLTNDAPDDLLPTTFDLERGDPPLTSDRVYYFQSLRKGDTLYNQDTTRQYQGIFCVQNRAVVPLLTDTAQYVSYTAPVQIDEHRLLLKTTRNGRRELALLDVSKPSTNGVGQPVVVEKKALSLLTPLVTEDYQFLSQSRSITFFSQSKDSLMINTQSLDHLIAHSSATTTKAVNYSNPWLQDYVRREDARRKEDSILKAARAAGGPSFLDGVFSRMNTGRNDRPKDDSDAYHYTSKKTRTYVLQLFSAYFSAQVNNDFFFNRYQPYGAYQGTFKFPDVGGMIQGGLSDLFEHQHISFAYRLPAGNEGSMFFTKYSNTTKRLDWSLAYYRNVEQIKPDPLRAWMDENGRPYPNAAKVKTNYYELGLSYPLTYYASVGGNLSVRQDRTIFQATDRRSLTFPPLTDLWTNLSAWQRIKHIQPTVAGLQRGWRTSMKVDMFKGIIGSESALAAVNGELEWHKPLYKYITLVAKAKAGISGGDNKVLFNLGGVDNSLTVRLDSTVRFRQYWPFAFQTLVTPLRGYIQNQVFGSSYCLINADVYFPLFETLVPLETNFPSLNNLQLGAFTDFVNVGGAISKTPARDNWLFSYGLSARTILAGYPLRFDIAWPGTFAEKPVWYLSLSLE